MKYNFDTVIDRMKSSSVKWDGAEGLFGEKDLLPLWVADMDFKVPDEVSKAVADKAAHGIFGYTIREESYYQSIIDWMKTRHNWAVEKEWICHSPGVVTALSLAVQAFTEPGDKVIVQPPVYYPFMKVTETNNREVVYNPLVNNNGTYEMDFDDLVSKIDESVKVLMLCNPHNPGGFVWKKEELQRLGDICMKYGIIVISDEIHSDLVFRKGSHIPFASISEQFAQRSITCTAPSKTFNLAGLQTSNIIIPNEELREKFSAETDRNSIGMPNSFGPVATEAAYSHGVQWLDEVLEYVAGNLKYVTEYFAEHIPALKVLPLEATYLAWIDCRGLGMTPEELETFFLSKAHVALNQGKAFGPGGEGFVRMNLACSRSIIEKAAQQIKEAVDSLPS
ncbi:pyridoxal phosphate-dependent aminotransferase [Sporosarcina jeotgali]|uniref:cysteine-S-conjugate beta-lyase n=1 Tax=Sporosarcina jeotgali TaxID=3020056 RepID=A0ABZ0KRZ5_9BACL|nr:MalY/PatB family protein [Sporosarcina sp. B2O-1]WOV82989.1 pyridoxal phosphate-dependent aminotransferase [Sporosarcina sp. B2O-1]